MLLKLLLIKTKRTRIERKRAYLRCAKSRLYSVNVKKRYKYPVYISGPKYWAIRSRGLGSTTSLDKVDWPAELTWELGSTGTLKVTFPLPLATVVNLKKDTQVAQRSLDFEVCQMLTLGPGGRDEGF